MYMCVFVLNKNEKNEIFSNLETTEYIFPTLMGNKMYYFGIKQLCPTILDSTLWRNTNIPFMFCGFPPIRLRYRGAFS